MQKRLEHRSGLAIGRSLEASFADVVGDQRLRAQPVNLEPRSSWHRFDSRR
jgi:hypothetical protein